jgi:hypothetical protein
VALDSSGTRAGDAFGLGIVAEEHQLHPRLEILFAVADRAARRRSGTRHAVRAPKAAPVVV